MSALSQPGGPVTCLAPNFSLNAEVGVFGPILQSRKWSLKRSLMVYFGHI